MAIDDKEVDYIEDAEFAMWLLGWKPGFCEGVPSVRKHLHPLNWDLQSERCPHGFVREHNVAAPDLTSDALYKAIIEGLITHGFGVSFLKDRTVSVSGKGRPYYQGWHYKAPTLLDAARAAWLREQEQK